MSALRPAQQRILEYESGYMAVTAVPGSGKTFTLTRLATQLVLQGKLEAEQQILIVTYLNTSVENFKKGIRKRLTVLEKVPDDYEQFFDIRTLHSLGLEILRYAGISDEQNGSSVDVTDEVRANYFMGQAVDSWIDANRDEWERFLPNETPQARAQWRQISENMARNFIRMAKNNQYAPAQIVSRLEANREEMPWVWMLAGIYDQYQRILDRQGAFDFNDLILQAVRDLERRPQLAEQLQKRWRYILEDEAQDSIPLQEVLLRQLAGKNGNLVRVGDPNQAITTTFTAAHPRYLKQFMRQPNVRVFPLPNSGRCAPIIFGAANELVRWVSEKHSVPEVREHTFLPQWIEPTPPGDAQPNPDHIGDGIRLKVYKNQEDEELPAIAQLANQFVTKYPDYTVAILVPTHRLGHIIAGYLDTLKVDYDNLLRGGARVREVAAALHAVLAVLAEPLQIRHLMEAYHALQAVEHPSALPAFENDADKGRFDAILRSIVQLELLLYPNFEEDLLNALPAKIGTEADLHRLERFAQFLQTVFSLRTLPIADLTLTLSDAIFATHRQLDEVNIALHDRDLDVAYQIATTLQRWQDSQPMWRLPDLVANLADVARGRQSLRVATAGTNEGFEPQPGRITLATQHGAKGLEWDAVFLVGIDGRWIPKDLDGYFQGVYDFLGGEDPSADVLAQLEALMAEEGDEDLQLNAGIYPGRTATQSAHIDIISERLRLLYVGITRARRYLHISRSRTTRRRGMEQPTEPASALAAIYYYLKGR